MLNLFFLTIEKLPKQLMVV